jgi:hypothetical protein
MPIISKKHRVRIAIGAAIIALSCAVFVVMHPILEIGKSDQVYSTLGTIVEFSQSHLRLPKDCAEFVDWHNYIYPKFPWTTNELQKDFELKWGTPTKGISVGDHVLTVLNPAFKKNELIYNDWVVRRIAGY